MTVRAYHVDDNSLSVGDKAGPDGRFFESLTEDKQVVERVFERLRPASKCQRATAIFAFEDEREAFAFAIQNRKAAYYEVEIAEEHVCHIADWGWLGRAERRASDLSFVEECAKAYWEGVRGDSNPIVEILSTAATVVRVCSISAEERLAFYDGRFS